MNQAEPIAHRHDRTLPGAAPRSPGFVRMFAPGRLTLGVFFPIEAFEGSNPTMTGQVALARRAEALGFAALWFRDVPLLDPSFGDIGQIYDPWVYLGYILAQTETISLATGAIIFSLRHPLHSAKAAASVDRLSGGRLVLGIASGDRPVEFPAFGRSLETRGILFRETFDFFRRALREEFPAIDSPLGQMHGADLVPKPFAGELPLLVAGNSQQSCEWIARHSDGWITYPRPPRHQGPLVARWRQLTEQEAGGQFKPFAQSLYIDLADRPDTPPTPIHLGYRLGRELLIDLLATLRELGVNHIALNLKYGRRPAGEAIEEIGQEVLPHFQTLAGATMPV
ncbi:MAG: LLM class oxidoreductase [Rhodospirillales bacterium]|nr:LLM class oxidoreductase [Rhodospirillales bacterium]